MSEEELTYMFQKSHTVEPIQSHFATGHEAHLECSRDGWREDTFWKSSEEAIWLDSQQNEIFQKLNS